MLVGMDITTTGNLAITNANSDTWFSFRFPSADSHVDYAEQADRINRAHEGSHSRQNMIKNLKKKGRLR